MSNEIFPDVNRRYPETERVVEKQIGGVAMPLKPTRAVEPIGPVKQPNNKENENARQHES